MGANQIEEIVGAALITGLVAVPLMTSFIETSDLNISLKFLLWLVPGVITIGSILSDVESLKKLSLPFIFGWGISNWIIYQATGDVWQVFLTLIALVLFGLFKVCAARD